MDSSFYINDVSGDPTMDFAKSPASLMVMAATKYTRKVSQKLQKDFGIGAMDWRMLVMLTQEPDIPVARATEVLGIDKAAVSRALTRMHKDGMVEFKAPANDPRRKTWSLTSKGKDLHADMLDTALEMQETLLAGSNYLDIKTLNKILHQMLENIEEM